MESSETESSENAIATAVAASMNMTDDNNNTIILLCIVVSTVLVSNAVLIFESVGAKLSGIEPPDGVIEKSCKAHPENIRNEKQGRIFADGPKPDDILQYEKPEDHNYYDCDQGRLQTKKGIGPEHIDQELGCKYAQGNFDVPAAYPLSQDQKKRQAHEGKDSDPDGRDDQSWRRKPGLNKGRIPGSN